MQLFSINHKDLFKNRTICKKKCVEFYYSEGMRFNHLICRGIDDIGVAMTLVSFVCKSGECWMTDENSLGCIEEWY